MVDGWPGSGGTNGKGIANRGPGDRFLVRSRGASVRQSRSFRRDRNGVPLDRSIECVASIGVYGAGCVCVCAFGLCIWIVHGTWARFCRRFRGGMHEWIGLSRGPIPSPRAERRAEGRDRWIRSFPRRRNKKEKQEQSQQRTDGTYRYQQKHALLAVLVFVLEISKVRLARERRSSTRGETNQSCVLLRID